MSHPASRGAAAKKQGSARAWFVLSSDYVTFARNCDPAPNQDSSSNGSVHSSFAASSKHASGAPTPSTTAGIHRARSLSHNASSPHTTASLQKHASVISGVTSDTHGTPYNVLTTRRRLAQLVSALRMARLNVGWQQLFGAKQVTPDEEGSVSSDVVQQIAKLKELMTTFHVSARARLAKWSKTIELSARHFTPLHTCMFDMR